MNYYFSVDVALFQSTSNFLSMLDINIFSLTNCGTGVSVLVEYYYISPALGNISQLQDNENATVHVAYNKLYVDVTNINHVVNHAF